MKKKSSPSRMPSDQSENNDAPETPKKPCHSGGTKLSMSKVVLCKSVTLVTRKKLQHAEKPWWGAGPGINDNQID